MSRSKVKGQGYQGQKKRKTAKSSPLTMHCKACAVRCKRQAADGSIPWPPGVTGVHADGGLPAVYVW